MNTKETIEKTICRVIREMDIEHLFGEPIFGYSAADDPQYAALSEIVKDEILLPREIMPSAQTVVSFYIPFTRQTVQANRKAETSAREWALSYSRCNDIINEACEHVIAELIAQGCQAATFRATYGFDAETFHTAWPHKSAAVISGVGKFGKNRLVITRKGCAGRLGTIFVEDKLEPTPPIEEELCLAYQGKHCDACVKNCPVMALTEHDIAKHPCYDRCLEQLERYPDIPSCDSCGKCSLGPCAIFD